MPVQNRKWIAVVTCIRVCSWRNVNLRRLGDRVDIDMSCIHIYIYINICMSYADVYKSDLEVAAMVGIPSR